MTSKAVTRLHNAIHTLNKAKTAHQRDAKAVRQDTRALAHARAKLARARDTFEGNHKALAKGRDKASHLRDAEQKILDPLQAQQQTLQAAYDATVDPTTGLGDAGLSAQLASVTQAEAQVAGRYDPKIDSQVQSNQALQQKVANNRLAIQADRKGVTGDRKDLKHDKKALAHAKARVKADRKRALKDLKPAEYKMGLEATNKARQALGLKKVSHVIRPSVPNVVGGQVGKWIAEAQTILKNAGVPMSKMNARDIALIISHESGGNPSAVNNWDSNAAAGHPSEGLMQTIGPTFNSYKLPGHGKILNPVDNIIAGVRYAIARYGSISNVPGVRDVHAGGSYVGY